MLASASPHYIYLPACNRASRALISPPFPPQALFSLLLFRGSCFALSAVSSALVAAALSCWRFTFAAAARVDLGDGIGEEERTACSRRGKVAVFVCVPPLRSSSLAPVGFVLFGIFAPSLIVLALLCSG